MTQYHNIDEGATLRTEETAYILAFSIIMLNTNRYHSNDVGRMTMEKFVRSNNGMDGGGNLPKSLLCEIYASVAAHEIVTGWKL